MTTSVTDAYLAAFPFPLAARETDLLRRRFRGRYLSRPIFLEQDTFRRVQMDLVHLQYALYRLPSILEDGDFLQFSRRMGMSPRQLALLEQEVDHSPSRSARTDIYWDGSAYRLLEFNTGGVLGGHEIGELGRAQLANPDFATFATRNGLTYTDPSVSKRRTFLSEINGEADPPNVIGLIDADDSFAAQADSVRARAESWTRAGLFTLPGALSDLTVTPSGVFLGDQQLDAIYRLFMLDDAREDGPVAEVIDALFGLHRDGKVRIFSSLSSEVYGSKLALAALSSEGAATQGLPAEMCESLRRLIPWTRDTREATTVLPNGTTGDLLAYAEQAQADLILKPAFRHSGLGVVPGWTVEPPVWQQSLSRARNEPYILQQRVRPHPEPFPDDAGRLVDHVLNFGFFFGVDGFSGALVRGQAGDSGLGVVNVSHGGSGTLFVSGGSGRVPT